LVDEAALNEVRRVLEREITVEGLVLFGSHALGTAEAGSDVDLAIVSPDFQDMSFVDRQALVRPLVREALGVVPLDAVCYTPQEYEDGKEGFLPGIIDREGVPVG
jgi:predicted nucleotidyltransferase